MKKITNISFLFICSISILFIGISDSVYANSNSENLTFAPNQPAGFVVLDVVGEEPVNPGELFLACGPNDVADEGISYRLFYALTDQAPADPTTATEYNFGTTAGDGDGTNAFGFVITGLDPGEEYSFWLYQYDSTTSTFSTAAESSEVSGANSDGDGDTGGDDIGEESVGVDANGNWLGFANVFDLPADGGEFVFASEWGLADVRTDLDTENNTLTLFPNFNTYADNLNDEFWVDQTSQEGNKTFEGVSFIESTELAGNILEFKGNVESYTLSSDYKVTAFIRVFNADFSFNKSVVVELTETGNFELLYDDVDLENDVTVQYGFTVVGPNANPADLTDLGNVVVGPTTLSSRSFEPIEVQVYPNPVSDVLQIKSTSNFSSVELYSLSGRLLVKQANAEAIDMRSLSNGMYLLKLTSAEGQSLTKKIIKK